MEKKRLIKWRSLACRFSPIFYRRITVARRSSDLVRGDQLKPEGGTELSGVGEAVRIRIKVNEQDVGVRCSLPEWVGYQDGIMAVF